MHLLPQTIILDAFTEQGFCVVDNALPRNLVKELKTLAIEREGKNGFKQAGTGKNAKISQIRGDKIAWLEPQDESPAVQGYLCLLEELKLAINRHLMMGLVDLETHLALYDVGQAYHTHIDQFASLNNVQTSSLTHTMKRTMSMIVYLNEDWQAQDGGELKLYLDEHLQCPTSDARATLIAPIAGRMVLFLSDRFWHEVLPAQKPRLSVTTWFRSRA